MLLVIRPYQPAVFEEGHIRRLDPLDVVCPIFPNARLIIPYRITPSHPMEQERIVAAQHDVAAVFLDELVVENDSCIKDILQIRRIFDEDVPIGWMLVQEIPDIANVILLIRTALDPAGILVVLQLSYGLGHHCLLARMRQPVQQADLRCRLLMQIFHERIKGKARPQPLRLESLQHMLQCLA